MDAIDAGREIEALTTATRESARDTLNRATSMIESLGDHFPIKGEALIQRYLRLKQAAQNRLDKIIGKEADPT